MYKIVKIQKKSTKIKHPKLYIYIYIYIERLHSKKNCTIIIDEWWST